MALFSKARAVAPPPPDAAASPDVPDEGRWEIAAQAKRAWRTLKWAAYGLATIAALMVVGQIYLFGSLFFDIHPALGGAFVGVVTVFFAWFVARPIWRFLRMPPAAIPPAVELSDPALSLADVERRVEYDLAYLKGMRANPALADQIPDIDQAIVDARALATGFNGPALELGKKVGKFEATRILPLLAPLDRTVDAYIRKEALGVGSATAVSLNGTVDAVVVLWRNANMISRVGRLYYGRPSLRLSLQIIGDVAMSVVLSRVADDMSEMAGDTLGGVANRLGGMVAGPVMDGSVNALMTLKLGYAAKRRCRSFDVWSKRQARQAAAEAVEQVRRESTALINDFIKLCGGVTGAAVDVVGKAWSAPRNAWSLIQSSAGALTRRKPPQRIDG